MYNLLQQYDVVPPPEDSVLHDALHDRQAEYRLEIEFAQQYRDGKLHEMTLNVETQIVKLQDQAAGVVSRLEDQVCEYF